MKELEINKEMSNVLKGISCILIVAHHFCSWLDGRGYDNLFIHFIAFRGGVIGVTVFFFLSAWGLSESQSNNYYSFSFFVKRRLSKVFFPLAITNVLYYFFLLSINQKSFSFLTMLLTLFNIRYFDGVLWFCNVILLFYFIFYVSFLPKEKWIKINLCIMATILYSVIITRLLPKAPFCVYSIIGFPFGMVCSLYKDRILKPYYWGAWSFFVIIFLLLSAFLNPLYGNLFIMNTCSYILLFFLVLFLTITSEYNYSKSIMFFSFVGYYSYEIYLFHNKVLVQLGKAGYLIWYPIAFIVIVLPLAVLLKRVLIKHERSVKGQ